MLVDERMSRLDRIIPILIILAVIVAYFLLPEWGEFNLLFGFSVGLIGFGVTFVQDRTALKQIAVILTLPVTVIWFYSEPGFEPVVGIISFIAAYYWQPKERSLEGNVPNEASTLQSKRKRDEDDSLILESIDTASEPIGCVMIVTAILVVGSMFLIGANSVNPLVIGLGIFALSFIGIVVGILIGTIIDYLSKTDGTPIQGAVYFAVPIAFLMAIVMDSGADATIGQTLNELTATAFYGGIGGAFIGALLGAFSGLGIEKSSESEAVYPEGSWERAREIAIETFKHRLSKYNWRFEHVQIDSFSRDKEKGTLKVTVVEQKQKVFDNPRWWPIERYTLVIDRSGDILNMQSVPVKEEEKYKPMSFDQFGIEESIELENITPVTQVTHEGLLMRIEFTVKNHGVATRRYPYVEYKIAENKEGTYKERIVKSPPSWVIDLDARSITPVSFDATFEATTILLTRPPNKIIVRLLRKPWN